MKNSIACLSAACLMALAGCDDDVVYGEGSPDAGEPLEDSGALDGGSSGASDASVRRDAGSDAGARDAGAAADAGGIDGGAPNDDPLGLGDLFGDASLPGLPDLGDLFGGDGGL